MRHKTKAQTIVILQVARQFRIEIEIISLISVTQQGIKTYTSNKSTHCYCLQSCQNPNFWVKHHLSITRLNGLLPSLCHISFPKCYFPPYSLRVHNSTGHDRRPTLPHPQIPRQPVPCCKEKEQDPDDRFRNGRCSCNFPTSEHDMKQRHTEVGKKLKSSPRGSQLPVNQE